VAQGVSRIILSVTCSVFLSSNCDGGRADACRPSRSGRRAMLCRATKHVKLARRQVAKSQEVHARSLEYTVVLPVGRQRARDAAGSILNLAEPALLPCAAVLPRRWREFA
jgi:hypothetical protein